MEEQRPVPEPLAAGTHRVRLVYNCSRGPSPSAHHHVCKAQRPRAGPPHPAPLPVGLRLVTPNPPQVTHKQPPQVGPAVAESGAEFRTEHPCPGLEQPAVLPHHQQAGRGTHQKPQHGPRG